MNTPITDRASRCADYGLSVPIETARALERMCEELAEAAEANYHLAIGPKECALCAALAKFQVMKDEATK